MKVLCFFLLSLVSLPLTAAPPCFPGDPTALEKDVQTVWTFDGCIAYVHCDVNHEWKKFWVTGGWASCTAAIAANNFATWSGLSYSERASVYDAVMANRVVEPVDAVLSERAKALPKPIATPPSGLVTTTPTVYYIIQQKDKLVMLPVGTVPLGTKLDPSQSANGYYRVNGVVTWFGNTKPPVVFGK